MPLIESTGKETNKRRYDSVWLGLALGLICPWITFFLYYLIFHIHMTLHNFFGYLQEGDIFISTFSLSVFLSNLLVFFIFIWTKKDKSARGVVTATFVYAIYVAIMKAI